MKNILKLQYVYIAILLFLTGAVLGPFGDYVHVATATTHYPPLWPTLPFLGIPYWVPLLFGSATLIVGVTHVGIEKIFGCGPKLRGPKTVTGAFFGVIYFLAIYCLSGVLSPELGFWKDGILAACAVGFWLYADRTSAGAILAIATGAAGTAVEISVVAQGNFGYLEGSNQLLGVATWLPWLYITVSVAVAAYTRTLMGLKLGDQVQSA